MLLLVFLLVFILAFLLFRRGSGVLIELFRVFRCTGCILVVGAGLLLVDDMDPGGRSIEPLVIFIIDGGLVAGVCCGHFGEFFGRGTGEDPRVCGVHRAQVLAVVTHHT